MPRLALGAVQRRNDYRPLLWAMLNLFQRQGLQVQTFFYQSRFESCGDVQELTQHSRRQLDSWIMTRDTCRSLFVHGSRYSDLALVDGWYDDPGAPRGGSGSLNALSDWLGLGRLAVIDASQLQHCALPALPPETDGILLDSVASPGHLASLRTSLEAVYGAPVLGWMEELRGVRSMATSGTAPSTDMCRALGEHLERRIDLPRILECAGRGSGLADEPLQVGGLNCPRPVNIAVAYDESFYGYFPDTLDLLEARGAKVRVFSPLRSETLPPDTDLVYLGCGPFERYAGALAQNCCLKQALRNHVASGRRVYAEGAGLAYLCHQVRLLNGQQLPMVGAIPALSQQIPSAGSAVPVEGMIERPTWLWETGTRLRGYADTGWRIEGETGLATLLRGPDSSPAILGSGNVIGSLLHLNFAAEPRYLGRFFQPLPGTLVGAVL